MVSKILELRQETENQLELFLNNLDSEGSRRIYQFELNKFFEFVGKEEGLVESLDVLKFKASLSINKFRNL